MFRSGNEPFTWEPVYAECDVWGWYARSTARNPGVTVSYESKAELDAAMARDTPFEWGFSVRPGAEPTHWTQRYPDMTYTGSRLGR